MKKLTTKLKSILATIPSNAFLLLITGFFFTQFMLVNILYINHPLGGWVTSIGTVSTASMLLVSLSLLSVCLFALWRSVNKQEDSKDAKIVKATITKIRNNSSPIDYPKGTTEPVVSGYALG